MTRGGFGPGLAALILLAGPGLRTAETPENAAQASAAAWLATVDAGKYGQSWDEASATFRAAVGRAQWEAALENVRRPLGKAVARKLRGAKFTTEIPNAPVGEYVVIQYDTTFENAPGKIETITPMKDRGVWRISGYYIK